MSDSPLQLLSAELIHVLTSLCHLPSISAACDKQQGKETQRLWQEHLVIFYYTLFRAEEQRAMATKNPKTFLSPQFANGFLSPLTVLSLNGLGPQQNSLLPVSNRNCPLNAAPIHFNGGSSGDLSSRLYLVKLRVRRKWRRAILNIILQYQP